MNIILTDMAGPILNSMINWETIARNYEIL